MSELLIHYAGLKQGQSTWYYNRRLGQVPVYPGEWVRLDLARHPEVEHCMSTGVAVVQESAPADVEVLDEDTDPNRHRFATLPPEHRPLRGRGRPEVFGLSDPDLDMVARCLLPKFTEGGPVGPPHECYEGHCSTVVLEGAGGFGYVNARADRRGAESRRSLHPLLGKHFLVLHRVAELKARLRCEEVKQKRLAAFREQKKNATYDTLEYLAGLRRAIVRNHRLPSRKDLILQFLREWGIWKGESAPSPATLHRFRMELANNHPIRESIDSLILDLHANPRIILILI